MPILAALLACHSKDGTPHAPDPDFCDDRPAGSVCDGQTVVKCADHEIASTDPCWDHDSTCVDGGCVTCVRQLEVLGSDPAATPITVEVDPDPALHPWRARAVVVTGSGSVEVIGPFVVLHSDGSPVSGPVTDETLLVGATAVGDGELRVLALDGCDSDPAVVALAGVAPAPIAVGRLDGFPWVETYDVFAARDTVSAWLDGGRYPDRRGLTADVYIVPHREPDAWAADPSLADAEVGPLSVTVSASPQDAADMWAARPSSPDLLVPYDVVADFGRDGRLDPGDLLDGGDAPAFVLGGDLSAPGPYTPVSTEYSIDFWHTMRVYSPLEVDELDPMPLVVISHGNGHDYTWYDYLGDHLASHGYVVIAHRNNTGPGTITAASTTWENTDVFLDGLATAAGGQLDGEIDTHAIAWIGHSRGGEGVVIAYRWLADGDVTPEHFAAADVRLVSSIAPTVFQDPTQLVNPGDVAYHLLAGSSDGDVTGGVDNPITQYFRILQNSTGTRAVTYVHGATHNDFNCCGFDDGAWTTGPGERIGREAAQQLAQSYYLALLEATFHGQSALWEYFTRAPERFRPDGTEVVVVTQVERPGDKLVIDDFQANPDLATSSSGGAVTATMALVAEGALDDRNGQLTDDPSDPFNGMSQSEGDPDPARGLVLDWNAGDDVLLEFEVPEDHRDWTADDALSFRACQATRAPNTVALDDVLSFGVALVDGAGNTSEIDHRVYGGVPPPFARDDLGTGSGWVDEFQTLRVPVAAFAADGRAIDLTDVVAVRFLFGSAHGSALGRIGLDDVELLAPAIP